MLPSGMKLTEKIPELSGAFQKTLICLSHRQRSEFQKAKSTRQELGELSATSDAIAAAIARRDGIHLHPSEAAAANLLNLSEQVPARIAYQTNRQRRRVLKVGQRTIDFRQRSPRKLAASQTGTLVMAALRSLGPRHVTPTRIAHLRKLLPRKQRRRLLKDLRFAPAWMHSYLRTIARDGDTN